MSAKTATKKNTTTTPATQTKPAAAVQAAVQAAAPTTKKLDTSTIDVNKLEKDVRLIPIDKWDWSRLVYSEPQKYDIPDGSGHYRRIRIQYMYDEKTIGPAIVGLGKHYCFGVQPDNVDKDGKILKDKDTGKDKPLRGYKVPIVLTSQNKNNPAPTPEEQREVDFFEDWRSELLRYVTENKAKIGKGAKTDVQLEGMVSELLYYKKDAEGNMVEGVSPKLYANLIYNAKSREVGTNFYGPGDKNLDPLKTTGHFYMFPTVRFDGIFVGGKAISLQHHVYDATVEPLSTAPKKRLARTNALAEGEGDFSQKPSGSGKDVNEMMESDDEEPANE